MHVSQGLCLAPPAPPEVMKGQWSIKMGRQGLDATSRPLLAPLFNVDSLPPRDVRLRTEHQRDISILKRGPKGAVAGGQGDGELKRRGAMGEDGMERGHVLV